MEVFRSVFNFVKSKMDSLGGICPTFDMQLYERAFDSFAFDYKRWYPEDATIIFKRVILTPQLLAVLMYRLAHECYILQGDHLLKNDADICICRARDGANRNIL